MNNDDNGDDDVNDEQRCNVKAQREPLAWSANERAVRQDLAAGVRMDEGGWAPASPSI